MPENSTEGQDVGVCKRPYERHGKTGAVVKLVLMGETYEAEKPPKRGEPAKGQATLFDLDAPEPTEES